MDQLCQHGNQKFPSTLCFEPATWICHFESGVARPFKVYYCDEHKGDDVRPFYYYTRIGQED